MLTSTGASCVLADNWNTCKPQKKTKKKHQQLFSQCIKLFLPNLQEEELNTETQKCWNYHVMLSTIEWLYPINTSSYSSTLTPKNSAGPSFSSVLICFPLSYFNRNWISWTTNWTKKGQWTKYNKNFATLYKWHSTVLPQLWSLSQPIIQLNSLSWNRNQSTESQTTLTNIFSIYHSPTTKSR